ncbi:VirD4-like conjugal transfer protein, CD1115 family [Virgibacillus siamensis]|uniref:VirD4-like conjugal transfer protein, CD1115 family n=1 Tax=Virgibacillus siamensis TaxID=480071 RepID=UPI0009862A36|nr:type IV secretory system conjugative DNA transfer family protein [Virgibacillus siamensis]
MKTNGIITGLFHNKLITQPTDSKAPNRNHLVVGGPGSYKTQSYVMTNVLNERECSVVVTDPKGEIYEETAEIKKKQGYEVRVVNFKNMENSDRYNPFDYVRKNKDAATVANSIVSAKNNSDAKDIWYLSQAAFLRALILYSVYEMQPKDQNMPGILKFLQEFDPEENKDGENELDEQFMSLDRSHPARRAYELGYKKSRGDMQGSIIMSLLTTIADFIDDEVASFTSFSDFFVGDVGRKKMVIYVLIPVMDDTWEGLINLFFQQMFNELYRIGDENYAKLPQPVYFILDEFPNLGKFNNYEIFLATCRGYGIGVATIIQNITQLTSKYKREKAESIMGNCAVRICLGNVNTTTAGYFMKELGEATVKVETGSTSKSKGKTESNSASENFSYTTRKLKNLDEILTMNTDESIIIMAGKNPIVAKKAYQFKVFPGITSGPNQVGKFKVSQTAYTSNPNEDVLDAFQEKVRRFEDRQQEKREKQEFESQDDAAANFFG